MNDQSGQPAAYHLRIECCGETYEVPRSLDLAMRLEKALGPLRPLIARIAGLELAHEEVARIYIEILREEDAPPRREILGWLFDMGLAGQAKVLAAELMTLIAGNEAVAQWAHRQAALAGERP